ncbi:RNA-binding protein [Novymonas esmeraldas]|uniref:RNA-binding protein n=1 Tax=Novymonas esmeraldas TaxID=1808958 RepID=A0AAW0F372_9TRYP
MYYVAATAAPASVPLGTPMKDVSVMSLGQSYPSSMSNSAAAPPAYETIVLDPNGPRSQTNLFVRKLASAVTEDDMRKLFDQYGTILSFALMRDIHTGESLGTAFVRYKAHEEARAAMMALDGRELYGRPISIQWAKREHDSTPCGDARRKIRKLFVRNIPLDVTARHIRQIFSKFGAINNVTLHSDTAPAATRDGGDGIRAAAQPRNIAFILFQEDDVAEQAVSALHNTCPFSSCEGIPLMVKLAEDNRDRVDRKQRFNDSAAASASAKALAAAMMNASHFTAAPSVSPQTLSLSTSVPATLSPTTLSMDVSHCGAIYLQDGRATSMPPNGPQALPFAVATPPATAAPVLHAAMDANGNPTYVYVTPTPSSNGNTSTTTAQQHQMHAAGGTPNTYILSPNGLHGYHSPAAHAAPAALSPALPPYFQTVALPQVFMDPHGTRMQPPATQPGLLLSGAYPSYSSQPGSPLLSSPMSSQFDTQATSGIHPLMTSPTIPTVGSSVFSQHGAPSPLYSQSHPRRPASGQAPFSVSPHCSGAASMMEPTPTVSSSSDSPVSATIGAANSAPLLAPVALMPQTFIPTATTALGGAEVQRHHLFRAEQHAAGLWSAVATRDACLPSNKALRTESDGEMLWANMMPVVHGAAQSFSPTS